MGSGQAQGPKARVNSVNVELKSDVAVCGGGRPLFPINCISFSMIFC